MNRVATAAVVGLVVLLFLSLNVVASSALRTYRLDLTQRGVYTLSEAAARIAQSPPERVNITLYLSRGLMRDAPALVARADFIEEKFRQFERASGGKIRLTVIDPEPSSVEEDRAIAEGMQPLATEEGNLFLGMVATNTLNGREVAPLFNLQDPSFEQFLEFEVARRIDRLAKPRRPRIGLITPLGLRGTPPNPSLGTPGRQPFRVIADLELEFEVVSISPVGDGLPGDLDGLIVAHPKKLSNAVRYGIDQYLMRGGRAVFLVDPLCELDTEGADPRNPMSLLGIRRSSLQIPTLEAWGVTVAEERVALDLASALQLPSPRTGQPVRALQYLALQAGGVSGDAAPTITPDDPVTGRLNSVWLGTAGSIEVADGAAVTVEPLLRTTPESQLVAARSVAAVVDQAGLLANFVPSGEPLTLAARLRGENVPSAYPDGPPGEAEGEAVEDLLDDGETGPKPPSPEDHLKSSVGPVSVVLIADADLLSDGYWLREIRAGGMLFGYDRVSDTGTFILNTVDQMAGSGDLMELRARGRVFRPLEKLNEMEREAETAIAAETAAVNERIAAAERRINEIQSGRTDGGGAGSLYLTPEQEAALEEAQRAVADGRTARREIVYRLRKSIEDLKTRIMLINTAMVPGLLCVFAVGLGGVRAARRRADRRRGEG